MWKRSTLRGTRYSDNYRRMDLFYLMDDPWQMDSPGEAHRFKETNRLILEKFGHVGSILEIGCGEGHQSAVLQRACDCLTGLDVSRRAVERARKRCAGAEFIVGDIFSEAALAMAPFDLVTACEVLYYMSDVPAALRRIQSLGRGCLITYFWAEAERLDPLVLSLPGVETELIEFEKKGRWRAAWLRGA